MNRHETIEAAIRRALGDMGVKTDDERQDTPEQQQHVPVEAVLSNAIGGRIALNDDHSLARAIGASTLNGERL